MAESFKVDISLGLLVYGLFQNLSYSINSALSEFVDNSLQSFIDNEKAIKVHDKNASLSIEISIQEGKKIIIADNAHGINRENFQKAIKLGRQDHHAESSLSIYGAGMKTAACWFGSEWRIETSALNSKEKLIFTFSFDRLKRHNEEKIDVHVESEKDKSHYTKIIIEKPLRKISKDDCETKIIPHLEETFMKFKKFLSINIRYNGQTLSDKFANHKDRERFKNPKPLKYPKINRKGDVVNEEEQEWKEKINFKHDEKEVKGFIMALEKGSYKYNPGIRLIRNNRVIEGTILKPNQAETLLGIKSKYTAERIYAELHLNDFKVDLMKGEISNIDSLYKELKKRHTDLFYQATYYRVGKAKLRKQNIKKSNPNIIRKKQNGKIEKESSEKNVESAFNRISDTRILSSQQIEEKLLRLDTKKLLNLYQSICKISLQEHPYLSYIGSSAFLEILFKHMGMDGSNLVNFLNSKIGIWYNQNPEKRKRLNHIIDSIQKKGNMSKHDSEHEYSDAKQLHHDFKSLEDFICKVLDEAIEMKKP